MSDEQSMRIGWIGAGIMGAAMAEHLLNAGHQLTVHTRTRGKAGSLLDSFSVDSECAEAKRKCPICDKKMQKVIVGDSESALLIDKCPRGDGLWFDKGELHDIFDRAQLDQDNRIQELLTDMFGHNQD